MRFGSPVAFEDSFDGLYGLEIVEHGDGWVRGRVPVSDRVRQPFGLVHGGLFASMAESLASSATYLAVMGDGKVAMGLSNATSFVRPIFDGTVHAEARVRHRGASTWVWDVEITDDDGRLCAMTRMTIAVREQRTPPA
jgi:1,4-dihydroxy-2-naphthoyl-CoA hydrolase